MASTNKTSNLMLNQWISTDPVLRTDFNLDNAKIDAAVTRRALQRLTGQTLATPADAFSISLESWDMADFSELRLNLYPLTSATSGGESPMISLRAGSASLNLAPIPPEGFRGLQVFLYLLPGGVVGRYRVLGAEGGGTFALTGVSRASLTELRLVCGGGSAFLKGTEYSLYGLMK